MTDEQILKLISLVKMGIKIYWIPDDSTALKVQSITKRADEFSLCANFEGGNYAALDNSEINDFAIIERLK